MEIISGIERRRWSSQEKRRIVAESERPDAGVAEIARKYEISRGLLWNWRSQVRRGLLGPELPSVFLPVRTISEPANSHGVKDAEPAAVGGANAVVSDGKIEITLPDGTSVKVGHDIGLVTLRRVMAVLRR